MFGGLGRCSVPRGHSTGEGVATHGDGFERDQKGCLSQTPPGAEWALTRPRSPPRLRGAGVIQHLAHSQTSTCSGHGFHLLQAA